MRDNKEIYKREIINGVTVEYGKSKVTTNPQLNKFLQLEAIKFYVLPESKEERNIVIIKKIEKTNKKYPRMYSEIKKSPL